MIADFFSLFCERDECVRAYIGPPCVSLGVVAGQACLAQRCFIASDSDVGFGVQGLPSPNTEQTHNNVNFQLEKMIYYDGRGREVIIGGED